MDRQAYHIQKAINKELRRLELLDIIENIRYHLIWSRWFNFLVNDLKVFKFN